MPTYNCPECKAKVRTKDEVEPGEVLECPECDKRFKPRAEVIAFKDDDEPKKKTKKPAIMKAAPAKAVPAKAAPEAAEPAKKPTDDDDDGPKTYGVAKESEEELRLAEKNKPNFGAIRDKFKKSARGPAAAILVAPGNLLLAQGSLLSVAGLAAMILGFWPLWFTDVSASDEEFMEGTFWIFTGIVCLCWGAITCFGAVQMMTLGSYGWAIVGSAFGLFPLLAGIFGLIFLRDPRVIAGFAEPETGPIQSEETEKKPDEEVDDEDEDEDEEDEDERPAKRKRH